MNDVDNQQPGGAEPPVPPAPQAGLADAPADPVDVPVEGQHYVVPEKDRVPVVEKTAYAMGVVSDHYAQFSIHAFLMPFFNVVLGLSPVLIGAAMGLARLWDAVNDPLVGTLSDRCRSRFGRRRPFLFLGALATGIVFPLIWLMPTGWIELEPLFSINLFGVPYLWEATVLPVTWPLVWLVVALITYYTSYSLLSVPYEALGMELTPDYQERTNVYTFRTYVQKVFDLGNNWLLWFATTLGGVWAAKELGPDVVAAAGRAADAIQAALSEGIARDDVVLDPADEAAKESLDRLTQNNLLSAVPIVAIGVGLMIIASGLLPAFFCRERYHKVAREQQPENVLKGMLSLGGNLPFWVVAGSISIYLLGVMSNGVLSFYVHTYYIYDGDLLGATYLGGLHGTLGMVFGFVGAFVIDILARRYDKKPLLLGCVVVMVLSTVAWAFTYVPGNPYLTLATRPFISVAETGFWVLIISMRADVGDWDELKTGRRREGIIAASINWMVKLAITLAAVVGGILLQVVVGFDAELEANQTPETLTRLKWTYVIVQSCTTGVVLLMLLAYPLTRAKLADVRRTLEARRGEV